MERSDPYFWARRKALETRQVWQQLHLLLQIIYSIVRRSFIFVCLLDIDGYEDMLRRVITKLVG